jgi:DNA repair exonuclease SbcCD ATPase subunit
MENDLWRLEKWLKFDEGKKGSKNVKKKKIEKIEEKIKDKRELMMEMESKKNIVVYLNIVGKNIEEKKEDKEREEKIRKRIVKKNGRWDEVCSVDDEWKKKIKNDIMENNELKKIIEEIVKWIEKNENVIRKEEKVDMKDEIEVIEEKYNKLRELRSDLERCEKRVMYIKEEDEKIIRKYEGMEGDRNNWYRIKEMRMKMK